MSYLPFISDEDFLRHVHYVLAIGSEALKKTDGKFYENVIDPFGSMFEMAVNSVSVKDWRKFEKARQQQKTMQNAIGDFHNNILGSVDGWTKLERGKEIDLIKDDRTIIAEIKNKYNTVTGAKRVDHYIEFEDLVNRKASEYYGATAYFVQIIPKSTKRFDKCFVPSDRSKGIRKPANKKIREIDGYWFYAKVTGVDDALDQLHQKIPSAIKEITQNEDILGQDDVKELRDFFLRAYKFRSK